MSEHWSDEGPVCPHCRFQHTPDGPEFFDESANSFECGSCDKLFAMQVYISTSWTTSEQEQGA